MQARARVLFFAEAVTLAHVARPIALAKGLDRDRFDVAIACDSRYQRFLQGEAWQALPLQSVPAEEFLQALAKGIPVYREEDLRRYVASDADLIQSFKPDLIVGDFRLSLSVSARLAGIQYATITNAYWSPYYAVEGFPLPALPMTRFLPLGVARVAFNLARPMAFALHCRPLNRIRRENGLPPLGNDLRRVYTDADHVLYADAPEMFPTVDLPSNHEYLGPVLWSLPGVHPDWWGSLPSDRSIIYLTLGSSGRADILQMALDALGDLPVTLLVSTAGAAMPQRRPPSAYVAAYLPGAAATARSSLVICNGGSLTCQQALAAGVPVLGIASNMDQFLNMERIVATGSGLMLRADRVTGEVIRAHAIRLLGAANRIPERTLSSASIDATQAPRRFASFVERVSMKRQEER